MRRANLNRRLLGWARRREVVRTRYCAVLMTVDPLLGELDELDERSRRWFGRVSRDSGLRSPLHSIAVRHPRLRGGRRVVVRGAVDLLGRDRVVDEVGDGVSVKVRVGEAEHVASARENHLPGVGDAGE